MEEKFLFGEFSIALGASILGFYCTWDAVVSIKSVFASATWRRSNLVLAIVPNHAASIVGRAFIDVIADIYPISLISILA